jgi:hypothetical protein
MKLTELVVASHQILHDAGIPHAVGGAIAMAYHGRPRATMDVDINVLATADAAPEVIGLFAGIGFRPDGPIGGRLPVAGIPLRQDGGGATADLFFALDESYVGFVDRSELVPFGPDRIQIPILCADDLVVFKLSFGRARDWVDLEDLLATETPLDLDAIEDRLIALRGPTLYPRMARLRSMSSAAGR